MNEIIMAKKCNDGIALEMLEEKYHIRIPEKEKQFMLSISRGVPKDKDLKGTNADYMVARFISVSLKDKGNVWVMGNLVNDNINEICIPIAENGFGSLYCMVFYSENDYKIEYLPHDQDDEQRIFICSTYADFLDMLDLSTLK